MNPLIPALMFFSGCVLGALVTTRNARAKWMAVLAGIGIACIAAATILGVMAP